MKDRPLMSFDWALKFILRQKDNFSILEGFLADLLEENIKIEELLESESNKNYSDDRSNRVDLRAKDSKDREIIIEVQYQDELDYLERIYYGTSKSVVDNMQQGYKYDRVKKVISISIVYWQFLEKSYLIKGTVKFDDLISNIPIVVENSEKVFADYYFIQPKWFNDTIKTKFDEWVYLFKNSKIKGDIAATNIDKVQDKLDLLAMSREERAAYDRYELDKTIYYGELQASENKGIRKGLQQGIEQGMKQGKQALIETLRRNGMSEEDILKYTK